MDRSLPIYASTARRRGRRGWSSRRRRRALVRVLRPGVATALTAVVVLLGDGRRARAGLSPPAGADQTAAGARVSRDGGSEAAGSAARTGRPTAR
ncbi:MAG: hypothetical protein QOK49_1962 [Baekduia sp.]|nr:hypothetical protein [Baekduia sp.]